MSKSQEGKSVRSVAIERGDHGFLVTESAGPGGFFTGPVRGRFWAFSTPAEVATWMLENFRDQADA